MHALISIFDEHQRRVQIHRDSVIRDEEAARQAKRIAQALEVDADQQGPTVAPDVNQMRESTQGIQSTPEIVETEVQEYFPPVRKHRRERPPTVQQRLQPESQHAPSQERPPQATPREYWSLSFR